MTSKKKRAKKKFDAPAEVRSIARERLGTVKASRVIVPETKRRPRHKADPLSDAESLSS